MKSKNLLNLRASVLHGVWSSPSGSSKMLQLNWEQKKAGEKIVLLFSIIKGYAMLPSLVKDPLLTMRVATSIAANIVEWLRCQGRTIQTRTLRSGRTICKEMRVLSRYAGMQCSRPPGKRPAADHESRIVSKDVPFSAFDGQERNDLPITQMRHGNM